MYNLKRFYTGVISALIVIFFGALYYFLSYFTLVSDSSVLRSPIPPFNPYVFAAFAFLFFLIVLATWSYAFYRLASI